MKKISLIITSVVFCIAALFIFPAKEANANPLAVGGALYLGGAGIYVVGTLGVAAVAGLVELESCPSCQEDMEAHAANVWAGATQTAKDGLQLMVDSAVGLGVGMTALDANVNTWLDSQIDGITGAALTSSYGNMTAATAKLGCNCGSLDKKFVNYGDKAYGFYAPNGQTYQELFIIVRSSTIGINFQYAVKNGAYDTSVVDYAMNVPRLSSDANTITYLENATQVINYVNSKGVSTPYGLTASLSLAAAGVSAKVTEVWEEMTDAGLVLPVDNARPMAGNIPLTYDPVTDAYSGIDGVNVPREDITGYDYGKPHWKTLEDLAMLGLSGLGAGLYIDGWAGSDSITSVYDPVADITTTTTSTGTTTNVTTGETAVTGSTTTTTTGDTTGNPPVDVPPTTAPKTGEPLNPFKAKPMPIAALTGLFQLLAALIFYLIRLFTFIATLALIAPTPIDNPYFIWFTTATFQGITPYPLVQNLALFFLGFSVYRSVRRVFG